MIYRHLKQLIGASGIYGTTGEKYFITISSPPFFTAKAMQKSSCGYVLCWWVYKLTRVPWQTVSLLVDRKLNAKSGILPPK